jgi:hypothetical protein
MHRLCELTFGIVGLGRIGTSASIARAAVIDEPLENGVNAPDRHRFGNLETRGIA